MENADKIVEWLELAAVKAGNHTQAADDIDWFAFYLDFLCMLQFICYLPMIPGCIYGIVVCQIAHLGRAYLLPSVENCSSTCSVNKVGGKPL